jgi:hypothetical protein
VPVFKFHSVSDIGMWQKYEFWFLSERIFRRCDWFFPWGLCFTVNKTGICLIPSCMNWGAAELIDTMTPRDDVTMWVAQKCLLSIITVISSEGVSWRSRRHEDIVTLFYMIKKPLAFLCLWHFQLCWREWEL